MKNLKELKDQVSAATFTLTTFEKLVRLMSNQNKDNLNLLSIREVDNMFEYFKSEDGAFTITERIAFKNKLLEMKVMETGEIEPLPLEHVKTDG